VLLTAEPPEDTSQELDGPPAIPQWTCSLRFTLQRFEIPLVETAFRNVGVLVRFLSHQSLAQHSVPRPLSLAAWSSQSSISHLLSSGCSFTDQEQGPKFNLLLGSVYQSPQPGNAAFASLNQTTRLLMTDKKGREIGPS
jgi:hypothetical protein